MPNQRTTELLALDKKHVIHCEIWPGYQSGIVWERGQGVYLYDTEGKEYIDFTSQLMNNNLGYCRKEIIDAATEQMKKASYLTSFFGMTHPSVIENAKKLAGITPPGISHFFFCSGGSEANDAAMKTARNYWRTLGKGTKHKIISLYNAYHGASGESTLTSSVGQGVMWPDSHIPGHVYIPPYYCYKCAFGLTYPSCNIQCALYLDYVIKNEGENTVAAFLAEPVQGSTGVIWPPDEYWPLVRKICSENNVLLHADEVMTGFCRTGKMFALEHWGVVPDIMTMAKGISASHVPYGALGVSDKVWEGLLEMNKVGEMLWIGYTFTGHPVAAAASSAAIDIYLKEKVADNATKVGKHIAKRLQAEFLPLPHVGEVQGKGCFHGMELVKDKKTGAPISAAERNAIYQKSLASGLFVRIHVGPRWRLLIAPPCTITIDEVDKGLNKLLPILTEFKAA